MTSSSPLSHVTADTIWNEYVMSRSLDERLWIVVEGDDECHILDRHLNLEQLRTVPAQGKHNVVGAVGKFDDNGVTKAYFLMDADFGDLEGHPVTNHPRVSYTGAYDIEAEFLLRSSAVGRGLVQAFSWRPGIPPPNDEEVRTLWDKARALSIAAGAVRLASHTAGSGLATRDLPFAELLRRLSRGSLLASAIRIAAAKARLPRTNHGVSIATVRTLYVVHGDSLISGHDLLASIAAVAGRRRGSSVPVRELRAALHAVITCGVLRSATWVVSIERWAHEIGEVQAWICPRRQITGGC